MNDTDNEDCLPDELKDLSFPELLEQSRPMPADLLERARELTKEIEIDHSQPLDADEL